jgi:succinate dehydrogenase flavin-adding protein (antitoxin of CptAB toxin-antitoxin module)
MNLKKFLSVSMNPQLLRHLWSLVERSQSSHLLSLDDNSLVQWLTEQFVGQRSINQAETDQLNCYIRAKLPLIRDLAQQR